MRKVKKILIEKKTGQKFLVKELEDFHTNFGLIQKEELSKETAKSTKGREFMVLDPQFSDLWENLKRGPQVMIQKDIGLILAKTGVNKDSIVIDAGGGSGSLCLSLANVCKKVTVYENNPEHFEILAKNINLLCLENIYLKQENIYEGITEQLVDLITLDLPEPWLVDTSCLKLGGHLVVYLPNLIQVKQFVDSTRLKVMEIIELIERKWKVEGKIMRPEFEMLGHTGFMIFCRRLP
ncbi:MAG TPA: rRNA adenine N-6-methyltransferase family protein [Candidatus Nanoarchaeia archaeon]|nr:rRNA adenine N-6-methyltransferase family protein [Candidatus Nanoarchaeia archaeon]